MAEKFTHKPGGFSLFKNDQDGNDKRPNYTGDGTDLDGNPIRVSAWIKEGAKGKFMSCKFEYPKDAPKKSGANSATDDVPFINVGRNVSGHCYWG